ncbi:MAG: hypothetical protein A2Y33_16535 [Spirochaetes bacterium GWF1_51_8]|nr:MAG: hypothetical protein A2Y33_16535 [Spirochaetes bacterium GWF1_51_8]
MIAQAIKTLKRNQGLLFLGLTLNALVMLFLIALCGILVIPGVPLWIAVVCVSLAVLAIAVALTGARSIAARKTLLRDYETRIFGRRLLVLDSIVEFHYKGVSVPDEGDIWIHGFAKNYEADSRKAKRAIAASAAVLLLALAGAILALPQAINVFRSVGEFLGDNPMPEIPAYYIIDKPFTLDLSALDGRYDSYYLKAGGRIFESPNGVFTIGADTASADSLVITVIASKFGLAREVFTGKIDGTTRLLPNKITMSVVYPFKTEEYAELQDIEVWAGGKVVLNGSMTKDLTNIAVSAPKAETGFTGGNFHASFYPSGMKTYLLTLMSSDGDVFHAPEFTIKAVPNTPPSIKLLYPPQDIVLGNTVWTVNSLVESEDDQGIVRFEYSVKVTNKDPYLSAEYSGMSKGSAPVSDLPRYIKKALKFGSDTIELLPGDVAVVKIAAVDPFGAHSKEAVFKIVSPDFETLMEERKDIAQTLEDTIKALSNTHAEFQKDIANKNLAGADQKMKEMEEQISKIEASQAAISENYKNDENTIKEIKESLEQLKEITQKLQKQSESLKQMMEFNQAQMQEKPMELDPAKIPQLLKELKAMLKNMEYYQKFSELVNRYKILESTYDLMKDIEKEQGKFDQTKGSFDDQLGDMKKSEFDKVAELSEQLEIESKKLQMGDMQSFEKSDSLMSQMKNAVQDAVQQAGQQRLEEKIDKIQAIIEELFIDEILIREADLAAAVPKTQADWESQDEIVEKINALDVSTRDLGARIEEALEGLIFAGDVHEQIMLQIDNHRKVMDVILANIRDKNFGILKMTLGINGNYLGVVSLYLMKVNSALEKQMQQNQQQGQGQPQMMSMKMEDLVKMQGMMSQSLQSLLQQMQKDGQITPEMQKMMDELSALQKEIQKNLQNMMSQTGQGAISGGQEAGKMMDELIKGLESYQINGELAEKSKQIEEKLLDSQKALQSKGVSEERKSEEAKVYEISPPKENEKFYIEKIDLSSIPKNALGEYYKQIIKKYMSGKE